MEIRLLLLRRESRFGTEVGIALALVIVVGLHIARFAFGARLMLRLALAKLFLRRCDQTEIMFGVLIVVFRCDRIT